MLYAATTFKYTFDYHDEDVYWCTADVGWITGHTYVCYGPLLNGATSVMVSLNASIKLHLSNILFVGELWCARSYFTCQAGIFPMLDFNE